MKNYVIFSSLTVPWIASGLFAAQFLSIFLKWVLITKQGFFCNAYPYNNFLNNTVEGTISLFL